MCFDLLMWSASLQWAKGYTFMTTFLRILYLFDSIFSGIVWIDKLNYFHEEICFSNNDCYENRKKAIS